MDFEAVPIVDLKGIEEDPSQKRRVAQLIASACENVGFLYVINHNIPKQQTDTILDLTNKFFALPLSTKMTVGKHSWNRANPNTYRGYFPVQDSLTSHKEGFEMGWEQINSYGSTPFHEPNVWLEDASIPTFKEEMKSYFDSMKTLGDTIMNLIALGVGLPENFFETKFDKPISTLRILHYPTRGETSESTTLSCSEHTDSGVLTLLFQDDTGGLQVRNRAGKWIDVPFIPGSFVINLGDMLQRWTNNRFSSTVHRVLNNKKDRISIPYFYEPNFDAVIECLPTCVSEQKLFPSTVYGSFLQDKILQFVEFQVEPIKCSVDTTKDSKSN